MKYKRQNSLKYCTNKNDGRQCCNIGVCMTVMTLANIFVRDVRKLGVVPLVHHGVDAFYFRLFNN